MIGVIATVFGLAVVALQLSSTQFSPRLGPQLPARRRRPSGSSRCSSARSRTRRPASTPSGSAPAGAVDRFPRLAVSGAMLLLFVSVAAVIAFADHLAHSLPDRLDPGGVDARDAAGHRTARREGTDEAATGAAGPTPSPCPRAQVRVPADPDTRAICLRYVAEQGVTVALVPPLRRLRRGGNAGGLLSGRATGTAALPASAEDVTGVVATALDLGFERTLQQDVAFGIRQLVDTACKALSPAVNDPYTAVQSVHHLSDILVALAARSLGSSGDPPLRPGLSVVPSRAFADHLAADGRTDPALRRRRTHRRRSRCSS